MAATRSDKDKGVNVQVLLRCRPFNDEEIRHHAPQVITCHESRKEVTVYQNNFALSKVTDRTFTFDKVFGPNSQQQDLYDQAITPIVSEVLDGFNCTIFAYGQTGTGKTYTMEGQAKKSKDGEMPTEAGVIPRAVQQIFDSLESQNAEYSVKVTFLELYNEELTDLLAPDEIKVVGDDKQKKPLALMEDAKIGVVVRGLEEEIVGTASEIYELLERGSAKRRTAETLLNKQSSRSHSVFTITIHMKEATPEGEELIKCGKLNLVDLAGSENISRSGAREGRAREAGEINKSLLTLGRVITALVEHLGHIPYRDSKLTRLLRDSLGGRTKTCIIATVSPSVHCLEETLSTLDYAHRAKNIKNKPEVNQKTKKTALIKDLATEIERLRSDLYAQREKSGVYVPKERYIQEEAERRAMTEQIVQLEEELESTKKLVDEAQERYDVLEHQYQDLNLHCTDTKVLLADTRDELASTQMELQEAHQTIQEQQYVIHCQQQAEAALTNHACKLRGEFHEAAKDVAGLHVKLDNTHVVEMANKEAGQRMRTSVQQQVDELQQFVSRAVILQEQQNASLQETLQGLLCRKDEETRQMGDQITALRTFFLKEVDDAVVFVQQQTAKSVAVMEEMGKEENSHTSDLHQAMTAAISAADVTLAQIQESLANQQREVAAFAQQQREASEYSLEAATCIAEKMKGALGQLLAEVETCSGHVSSSHEAQDKQLAALTNAFQEQSRRNQVELLEGVKQMIAAVSSQQEALVTLEIDQLRAAANTTAGNIHKTLTSVRTIAHSAQEDVEGFRALSDSAAGEVRAGIAAKHCVLEDLLQLSQKGTEMSKSQWNAAGKQLQKLSGKHSLKVTGAINNCTGAAKNFSDKVESRRNSAHMEASKHYAALSTHVEDVHSQDKALVGQVRKALDESSVNARQFESVHGGSAKRVRTTIDCYIDKEIKDDDTVAPKKRDFFVPNEDSIHMLRAKSLGTLVQDYHQQGVQASGCHAQADSGSGESRLHQHLRV